MYSIDLMLEKSFRSIFQLVSFPETWLFRMSHSEFNISEKGKKRLVVYFDSINFSLFIKKHLLFRVTNILLT